jgi:hypothetical protein
VLAMVQAACRAAWNVAQQATTPPPVAPAPRETPRDMAEEMRGIAAAMHALDGEVQRDAIAVTAVTPSRNAMTGAERQKRYRDKHNATVTVPVTRNGSPSLSSKDIFNSEEREGEATVTPLRTVTPAGHVAISPDWQPNEKAAQLARDELGDVGAANCLAKFRDHYESTGAQLTPAGWQAKFRKWVRSERGFAGGDQRALPLVHRVAEATGPPRGWQPGMPTREELLKQWGSENGQGFG